MFVYIDPEPKWLKVNSLAPNSSSFSQNNLPSLWGFVTLPSRRKKTMEYIEIDSGHR